jgi:hypothetical protein
MAVAQDLVDASQRLWLKIGKLSKLKQLSS